jgi:pimeloyl-ACP methyl ester carboxylesterase
LAAFVHSRGYSWEYFIFGKGPEILFAFHGFDNDANDFRIFEKEFGERYTIVSINLFFHGGSDTPSHSAEDDFTNEILAELFGNLLFDLNCQRFSLLGFSLGGRIIMELIKHFPDRIDRVLLLAPDGLKISPWYVFITNTTIGHKIFKRAVYKAGNILRYSKILYKAGIVAEKQYLFALSNFDTLEKRKKVYNVWMIFRHILPKAKDVGHALKKYQIPVDIYFGKRDTIIRERFGRKFSRRSGYPCSIHVLDAGHNLMKEKLVQELLPWLERKKKVSV